MKFRSSLLIMLVMLASVALAGVGTAQDLAPNPTPVPTQQPDRDGDGIPDSDDQCPDDAGPRENRGCPKQVIVRPTPTHTPGPDLNADDDGDGVRNGDDRCPTVAGVAENNGCPPAVNVNPTPELPIVTNPTTPPLADGDGDGVDDADDLCPNEVGPPPSGCSDIQPLPALGCFVTPNTAARTLVRDDSDASAAVVGHLLPRTIYPAVGYYIIGTSLWFLMADYEDNVGTPGYAARSAVFASAGCAQLATSEADDDGGALVGLEAPCAVRAINHGVTVLAWARVDGVSPSREDAPDGCASLGVPSVNEIVVVKDMDDAPEDADGTTVEYCTLAEVKEAGVFEEVCYTVTIPDGCVLMTPEAGVSIVVCDEGGTVQLNPDLEGLPALELTIPSDHGVRIVLLLPAVQA